MEASKRLTIALALILLGATGPLAPAPGTYHYYTELYQDPQGGFPTTAYLDLTFRPDGLVVGYYRPTDGGVTTVTGSLSGNHISLSIGGMDGLQVTGTLKGGQIEGIAFRTFGRQEYYFIGHPKGDRP